MKLCKRCMAPETALNLVVDSDGICNLCQNYQHEKDVYADRKRLAPFFAERLARFSGRSRYDALVGISGGKDSSYVALRLARDYGLRLLLFTYDNGYLTDYARHNIALVVEKLGQDHIFVGPDHRLQRAIARSSVRRVGVPCIGCTFPGFLAVMKTAVAYEVPFIVHGRSPAQMFKELAPGSVDPFLPFLQSNLQAYSHDRTKNFFVSMSQRLIRRLRWFLGPELAGSPELIGQAQRLFGPDPAAQEKCRWLPEFIAFYLFHDYDENSIKHSLELELGWKRPEFDRFMGHEDCEVHAVAVYLYTLVNGHPILQPELATLVRQGRLSRQEAELRLAAETDCHCCNEPSMQYLQQLTGFSREEILHCARRSHLRLVAGRAFLKYIRRPFVRLAGLW